MASARERVVTYEEKIEILDQQIKTASDRLMTYGKAVKEDEAIIKDLEKRILDLRNVEKQVINSIDGAKDRADKIISDAYDIAKNLKEDVKKQSIEVQEEDKYVSLKHEELDERILKVQGLEEAVKVKGNQVSKKESIAENKIAEANAAKLNYELAESRAKTRSDALDSYEELLVTREGSIKSSNALIKSEFDNIQRQNKILDERTKKLDDRVIEIKKAEVNAQKIIDNANKQIQKLDKKKEEVLPFVNRIKERKEKLEKAEKLLKNQQKNVKDAEKEVEYQGLRLRRILREKEIDAALLEDKPNK